MNSSRLPLVACILALALTLLAALPAAGLCTDPCNRFILPDSAEVPLPLDGWLVPAGTAASSIALVEPPRFGTFSTLSQVYVPSSSFWSLGIDRLVVQAPGFSPKALILIAAKPEVRVLALQDFDGNAIGAWTYSGSSSFTYSAEHGYALQLSGAEGGVSAPAPMIEGNRVVTVGGGVTASPSGPPPCPSGCLQDPVVVQQLDGYFAIELKETGSAYFVRARATHSGFHCGGKINCATPFVSISKEVPTRLEVNLGYSSYSNQGPASPFSLRLNVTPQGGFIQHYEVADLQAVNFEGTPAFTSGLIGSAAPFYDLEVEDLKAWTVLKSTADLASATRSDRFEAPGGGYEEAWTQAGSVNLVRLANSRWAAADLAGLTASVASRSSLMDEDVPSSDRMRLTFTLDVSNLALGTNDSLMVFMAQGTDVNNRVFDLFVRLVGGVYSIRARAVKDDGNLVATAWLPLDPGGPTTAAGSPNTITAQYQAGAGDGFLRLQVNQWYAETTGIPNGTRTIESVSFGAAAVNVAIPNSTRSVRLDNIAMVY